MATGTTIATIVLVEIVLPSAKASQDLDSQK